MKAAADARLAAQAHGAINELDELAADGKAQSRATEFARDAAVGLLEGLEYPVVLRGCDADAGVGDRELQRAGGFRSGHGDHRDQHGAGLGELHGVVDQVAEHLAQPQRVAVDHSRNVAADVRGHLGDKVYDTMIPRNVRVSEAPSYGKPALLYDVRCTGSQAYIRLASELLRREGTPVAA